MKAWSDEDGWIDIETVWSGSMRTPIPGIGGLERKSSYLVQARQEEEVRRGPIRRMIRCACGTIMRLSKASQRTMCSMCEEQAERRGQRMQPRNRCICGRPVKAYEWRCGTRRCESCRETNRMIRRVQTGRVA